MGACSMHELRSARRAPPTGDPRPAAQRRAPRRRSRGRAEAQPARRVEAPAGAARRGAGRRASRRPAADVPPAAGAAGRDRRVAGALPPAVDPLTRPPRWIPGGEPMTRDGELMDIDGRPALRFERTYAHPQERVRRAVTSPAERKSVWEGKGGSV